MIRTCPGYNAPAHEVEETDFAKSAKYCRPCNREWRADHSGTGKPRPRASAPSFEGLSFEATEAEAQQALGHEYVPDRDLVVLWQTVVKNTLTHGAPPANLMFLGPSGSGKTDGAKYLAEKVGLPFTKTDAASMTDPESWFGTREVVVSEGVSVTRYVPSAFVEAVQRPGVVFIDEINRVDDEHRNVLLPLTDGTGKVTNPLTGETVHRHPHCFVIMAGNRGIQFTGTSAIDPAFMTRALTVEFDYIDRDVEERITVQETGCDQEDAYVLTRFAQETRQKALVDPEFAPISTREVLAAARLTAGGMSRDLAVKFVVLNGASSEGGSASVRQELQSIWNGVRVTQSSDPAPSYPAVESSIPDTCDECGARISPGQQFCLGCGAYNPRS